jgi:hypothetical protein
MPAPPHASDVGAHPDSNVIAQVMLDRCPFSSFPFVLAECCMHPFSSFSFVLAQIYVPAMWIIIAVKFNLVQKSCDLLLSNLAYLLYGTKINYYLVHASLI